jgi:hypothetical protein
MRGGNNLRRRIHVPRVSYLRAESILRWARFLCGRGNMPRSGNLCGIVHVLRHRYVQRPDNLWRRGNV